MRKILLVLALLAWPKWGFADATASASAGDTFYASFLAHVSAVDDFRQDGSRVVKLTDGIFQQIPYRGEYLLVESFGVIPKPEDSTKFWKSYSVHAHVVSLVAKFLGINPTYAPILEDFELTPGYTYDTDVHHGQFDLSIGYAHKFGGS